MSDAELRNLKARVQKVNPIPCSLKVLIPLFYGVSFDLSPPDPVTQRILAHFAFMVAIDALQIDPLKIIFSSLCR